MSWMWSPNVPTGGSVPLAGFRIDIARARVLGARPDGLDPGQDLIDGHLKKLIGSTLFAR